MASPGIVGRAVVGAEPRAGEIAAAWFTVLLQEVRAQPIDQVAKSCLLPSRLERNRRIRHHDTNVRREHRVMGLLNGPVVQESVEAVADADEDVPEPGGSMRAGCR